jgi:DNA-binding XRE family transcriptional regulator
MHAFLTTPNLTFLPIPLPNFGATIKRRRIELGLNCARAAASVGVNKEQWQLLEQGWGPTIKNDNFLRSLASVLEIRFDDLACVIAPLETHFANTQDQATVEHHEADRPAA